MYVIRWGCLEIHLTPLRCLGTSSGIRTLMNQGFCAQWVEDQSTPFLNFWVLPDYGTISIPTETILTQQVFNICVQFLSGSTDNSSFYHF